MFHFPPNSLRTQTYFRTTAGNTSAFAGYPANPAPQFLEKLTPLFTCLLTLCRGPLAALKCSSVNSAKQSTFYWTELSASDHVLLIGADTITGKNEDGVTYPIETQQTSTLVPHMAPSVIVLPRKLSVRKNTDITLFIFFLILTIKQITDSQIRSGNNVSAMNESTPVKHVQHFTVSKWKTGGSSRFFCQLD